MSSRALSPSLARATLLLAFLLPLATACGQGGKENEPTPTPTREVAAPDIRGVDFTALADVRKLIDSLGGGEVLLGEIIFADLTGDGQSEAVVPVASGGSAGIIAYAVFGYEDGSLRELLAVRPETGRVSVAVEDGVLKETQPLYGPEDPFCCPRQLWNQYYRWDGRELVVDRQETIDNPPAKP